MTELSPTQTDTLSRRIADETDTCGAITFERFMELALYDSDFGYYTAGKARMGRKGDFYTSPSAHGAFGQTLAGLAGILRKKIGADGMTFVEAGGGGGRLAVDILSALEETDPASYEAVEYVLVDRSPQEKCEAADRHGNFRRVKSFSEIGKPVCGIIFSNELFDALPFHRLVFRNGEIAEIFVSRGGDGFTETEAAPSDGELVSYFDRCGGAQNMGFAEGQKFEVSLKAGEMMKQMAQTLERGLILTIDYGFQTDELFSPDRRNGTFKCVSGHTINESPYENIGGQDITAHVDFGNLEKTGQGSGLATLKYTTQGQFLVDWGIMDTAARSPEQIHAIKTLFMPGTMGDSFRVLMQTKNAPELAQGFYPESPFRISFGVD
ncbi:MAG: class I SAM-dependent methyltransferase [Thermodesulfobacteriota bacterium]